MHKTSTNAKLLNLSAEQQAQLAEWLLNGMPYHLAAGRVAAEFGVTIASTQPFTEFWRRVCVPELLHRRNRALEAARYVAKKAAKMRGQFDVATLEILKQKAFEIAIAPDADATKFKAFFSLVLQARKCDLDERQLALAREKHQFDGAKSCLKQLPDLKAIVANPALDQKAKIDAIREKLFGKLPSSELQTTEEVA